MYTLYRINFQIYNMLGETLYDRSLRGWGNCTVDPKVFFCGTSSCTSTYRYVSVRMETVLVGTSTLPTLAEKPQKILVCTFVFI